MSTVWIVTSGEWDDYCIKAPFTTKEKAEAYYNFHRTLGDIDVNPPSEYNLDPTLPTEVWASTESKYGGFRWNFSSTRDVVGECVCKAYCQVKIPYNPDKKVMLKAARARLAELKAEEE